MLHPRSENNLSSFRMYSFHRLEYIKQRTRKHQILYNDYNLQLGRRFIDQLLLFDILLQRAKPTLDLSALGNLVKFLL